MKARCRLDRSRARCGDERTPDRYQQGRGTKSWFGETPMQTQIQGDAPLKKVGAQPRANSQRPNESNGSRQRGPRKESVQSFSRRVSMPEDRAQRGSESGSSWRRHDWRSASGDVRAVRGGSPEEKESLAAPLWLRGKNLGRMGRLRVARMRAFRNERRLFERPHELTWRSDACRGFGNRRAGPTQDRRRPRATAGLRRTHPAAQASGWR